MFHRISMYLDISFIKLISPLPNASVIYSDCDSVILPPTNGLQVNNHTEKFCPTCQCKYESRNTTTIKVSILIFESNRVSIQKRKHSKILPFTELVAFSKPKKCIAKCFLLVDDPLIHQVKEMINLRLRYVESFFININFISVRRNYSSLGDFSAPHIHDVPNMPGSFVEQSTTEDKLHRAH